MANRIYPHSLRCTDQTPITEKEKFHFLIMLMSFLYDVSCDKDLHTKHSLSIDAKRDHLMKLCPDKSNFELYTTRKKALNYVLVPLKSYSMHSLG